MAVTIDLAAVKDRWQAAWSSDGTAFRGAVRWAILAPRQAVRRSTRS